MEEEKQEKFFDGERYYSREEFFNVEEEEEWQPQQQRRWVKMTVVLLIFALFIGNILAFWPQVYHLAAIQFLIKSRELSQNEHIQTYKQSIVVVSTDHSKGTGFIMNEDGFILTNEHVVDDQSMVHVKLADGDSYIADVVMTDASIDMALLKLRSLTEKTAYLALDAEHTREQGIPVYVIGNPLFFNHIANEGITIGETLLSDWPVPVFMIDAPIYKGNSGSPVINENGKVIGVIFATMKVKQQGKSKKVGLAVPIEAIEKSLLQ